MQEGNDLIDLTDRLGSDFMLPPQFEHRREELLTTLEPIDVEGATS